MTTESGARGTLYICATPIGNLEDITLRALRVLRSVDFIAAEDTRHTRKLLSHHGISTRLVSYHEHNKSGSGPKIIASIIEGHDVALVSDAGMPAVSDPGADIVRLAIEAGVKVVPVPGASAVVTAVAVAGFTGDEFQFAGFLPREKKALRAALSDISRSRGITVFYEAPHRLRTTLAEMAQALPDRQLCIAREITKIHEEFWRGTAGEASVAFAEREARGEITIVIDGAPVSTEETAAAAQDARTQAEKMLSMLVLQGVASKEAARQVAEKFAVKRNEMYRLALLLKRET